MYIRFIKLIQTQVRSGKSTFQLTSSQARWILRMVYNISISSLLERLPTSTSIIQLKAPHFREKICL